MSASVLGLNPSRTLEKSRARLKAKRTAKKEAEEAAGKGGKNHRDASSSSGKENSKANNNNNASSSSSSAVNASVPPKKGSRAALQKVSKALTPQEELFDLDKCMSAMNMYVEKFITRDAATVAADDLREQEAEDRAVKDAAALAEREQEQARQEEQRLKKKAANTDSVAETNTGNADEEDSSSGPAMGADTSAAGVTSTPTPNTAADALEMDDAQVAISNASHDDGVKGATTEHEHEHEHEQKQNPPQVAGVSISDMLKVPL